MYSQAVHVDGAVNAAGIQKDLDFFQKQGMVAGQIKASDVIDIVVCAQCERRARTLPAEAAVIRCSFPMRQVRNSRRNALGRPSQPLGPASNESPPR
jgi:hypothetical protein